MTRLEEYCLRLAARGMGLTNRLCAMEEIAAAGLIDRRACERAAIRERMAELTVSGLPRCEAMEVAAREFCCSYEKIRKVFYESFAAHTISKTTT